MPSKTTPSYCIKELVSAPSTKGCIYAFCEPFKSTHLCLGKPLWFAIICKISSRNNCYVDQLRTYRHNYCFYIGLADFKTVSEYDA